MLKRALCTILLLIPALAWAQNPAVVDSLVSLLSQPKVSATQRIDLQNEIGLRFAKSDSVRALKYVSPALAEANRLNYKAGIAAANRALGVVASYKNRLPEALSYLNKSAQVFTAIHDEKRLGQVYSDMGTAYLMQNHRKDAITYFERAEKIHRRLNDTPNLLTDINQLGVCYYQDSNSAKAITYLIEAAALAEKVKDQDAIPLIYSNLGQLFSTEKNYNQAIIYFKKAISLLRNNNRQRDLGIAMLNLANVYTEKLDYKQAALTYSDALEAFTKSNFTKGVQVSYNNMGAVALRRKQYQQAIPMLEKSLAISQKSNNYTGVALTLQNIAYAYIFLKQYQKAEDLFNEAEQAAIKYKNNAAVFGEIYNHRAMLDSAMGKYDRAFQQRNMYFRIKDSLLNATQSKQINELQTKYETEKNQREIQALSQQNTLQSLNLKNQDVQLYQNKLQLSQKQNEINRNKLTLAQEQLKLRNNQNQLNSKQFESKSRGQRIKLLSKQNIIQQLKLNQQNMIIYSIGGMFALFIIIVYLAYNRYRLKQAATLQTAVIHQQQLAAKGIVEAEEQERKRISADLHDGLGQLFTAVKMNMEIIAERYMINQEDANVLAEKTLAMVDESCIEVRSIAHQMMPNALLKSGLVSALRDFVNRIPSSRLKITVETIGLDERLENNVETVLYRVIQESVNNVIKHAEATLIDILLLCDNREITITIEDNGNGFDSSNLARFNGIGLRNIITRVEYLKGTVDISSAPGKGTLVAIHVPLA